MDKEYLLDLYTTKRYMWLNKYNPTIKNGPYGDYYKIKCNISDRKKIIRFANRHAIKYRVYEKKWERSSNYRELFFKENKGPYRCRYCNKWLNKKYMTIDHIIPISKAKKSMHVRNLLYIQKISDINDIRNLAPSCSKCNNKKGDKVGFWFVRGVLGKYDWYWKISNFVYFILFLVLCIAGYCFYMHFLHL